MSTGDLISLLRDGGPVVVVCALLISGVLVPKWAHDDVKKQRDEWKRAAEVSDARADALMDVASVTRDVMNSLHHELTSAGRHKDRGADPP